MYSWVKIIYKFLVVLPTFLSSRSSRVSALVGGGASLGSFVKENLTSWKYLTKKWTTQHKMFSHLPRNALWRAQSHYKVDCDVSRGAISQAEGEKVSGPEVQTGPTSSEAKTGSSFT